MPTITLTTDFGLTDSYVGQMKGAILSVAPTATIVDLSHGVPPQDIATGSLLLASAAEAFAAGTVHVAVVDPGVGSARNPIAVRTARHTFIGPDNGLFTAVLDSDPALEVAVLSNPRFHRSPTSATFHGRDIFAPVAAHLANGTALSELGPPPTGELVRLAESQPERDGALLRLHVVHVDRFGNLITDLTEDQYRRWRSLPDNRSGGTPVVRIGGFQTMGIETTFGGAPPGQAVAYFGSSRRLEVAIAQGNAAQHLNTTTGDTLVLGLIDV